MKIRKIKFLHHPILGNLEVDFVNHASNQAYDTIVFAGENGTGKTSILSSLNEFLCLGPFSVFEYIEYEVNGNFYKITPVDNEVHQRLGWHNRIDMQNMPIMPTIQDNVIRAGKNSNENQIKQDILDIRHYGSVFSKARADFSVKTIKGTTSLDIDKYLYDQDINEDFSSLKQLIIDLQSEDNELLSESIRNVPNCSFDYEAFKLTTKIYRFSKAFDNFFEVIKYGRVVTENGEKNIVFKKNGININIDQLSTGEKQIVYRGIYLLRNVGKLDGATVMIDEPELSMHPKWQKRILKYFKDLFSADDGTQKTQLLFATHSEYVIQEALTDNNTLVVVLTNNGGVIDKKEIRTPLVLPTITASEINYAAFDVPSIDYHIALYGAIQSKYNLPSVFGCDRKIESCIPYYNPSIHESITSHGSVTYKTICTKVRNHIDHPDTAPDYTEEELIRSIELMREILINVP